MLTRYREPRVTPLELWDLVVEGTPLYLTPRDARFGRALERAVEALVDGTAVTESGAVFPDACRRITRVVLAGGGARDVVVTSSRFLVERATELEFSGEAGGKAILAREGKTDGVVVDLGQSRLKVTTSHGRRVYERDFGAIPIAARPCDGRGREAFKELMVGALGRAAEIARPGGIVLALSCAVDSNGALETCSYPWSAGEPIVPELLDAAGLTDVPTWLVNDAELVAIGVAAESSFAGVTLVLTLGFGVGGALIGAGA